MLGKQRVEVKGIRNLKRDGPVPTEIAGNERERFRNMRDLEDQVKNQWLQEMRRTNERREKLLKEMEVRALRMRQMENGGAGNNNYNKVLTTEGSNTTTTVTAKTACLNPL